MKTKTILVVLVSLFTFAAYSQTAEDETIENKTIESKTAVTGFTITIEHVDELENFDWKMVKDMFKSNDGNQEITLGFSFVNNDEIDTSKIRANNFNIKLTGKTSDLEQLISKLRSSVKKLFEIYSQD